MIKVNVYRNLTNMSIEECSYNPRTTQTIHFIKNKSQFTNIIEEEKNSNYHYSTYITLYHDHGERVFFRISIITPIITNFLFIYDK